MVVFDYERLIVAVHHGRDGPHIREQHSQIAAVYDKCAADYMVPAPQRAAFARKAETFRILARLGAKPRLAPPKKLPPLLARVPMHWPVQEWSQRRGTYLRGSTAGSLAKLAAMRLASCIVSTFAVSASVRLRGEIAVHQRAPRRRGRRAR